ncbi:MAG: nucleoside-diphosphate sugar epimerase/dehydratase, partial [Bacteroidales bacterium]
MLKFLQIYFSKRYLPRWMVLIFDSTIVLLSFLLAYILRFNFDLAETTKAFHPNELLLIALVFLANSVWTKSFAGVLRKSTIEDIARIIFSLGISSGSLILFIFLIRNYFPAVDLDIPYSVLIIQFFLASNILVISRWLAKMIYNEWAFKRKSVKKVIIYGAGELGLIAWDALKMDTETKYKLVGFIEHNRNLLNKRLEGVPIYSLDYAFNKIIPKNDIKEIIIASDNQGKIKHQKRELVDLCLPFNIEVKEVPSVEQWMNGSLRPDEIKKINIEDLLGRDSIKLDFNKIQNGVVNSVVLVAGAAGSIGSEIVRQLMSHNAYKVILLDKAESDLYDLQNEIFEKYENSKFTVIVGDVTNPWKMEKIFKTHAPSIVLNAAAYKHVPLMEEFPGEAIHVNIGGTKILADLSLKYGVEKFVLISTDKAVNPTNVMGASKRIAETYIQSLSQKKQGKTQFITTRFGNVLGSNGSVVPLFKKQIANGGPVKVTHREITRFFMTIPEACQLVLEACFMGNGGEIFVFDMGESVKIYDMAEKMIYLSGYVPNKDIEI